MSSYFNCTSCGKICKAIPNSKCSHCNSALLTITSGDEMERLGADANVVLAYKLKALF